MADRTNWKTRRTVLNTVGSAGALGLLAGCLGGGDGGDDTTKGTGNDDTPQETTADGSDDGGSQTKFRFWTTQVENNRVSTIEELVKSFEQSHQPTVDMRSVAENDLPSQISAARAAGRLPTVGEWGLGPMQNLGSGGLLSKKAAENIIKSIGEDKFYDGALKLTRAPDGGHYAVPFHGWIEGFWYSKSAFEEQELPEPTTWENLLAAAKALHKPDQGQFGLVVGTKKTAFARQCFTPFARSNGARVFNEQGEVVFDSDEMVEALDFYAKLAQYTPPGKDTWKTANHTYKNDQTQLIQYSSYLMGGLAKEYPDLVKDTGFAPYVEHKRKSTFGQVVALNVLSASSTQQRQAGEKFAEYLLTGDEYIKWLHMAPGGMNPVLKPTAQSEEYKSIKALNAWGETAEKVSQGFANIERFGYVKGKAFPKLGNITSQFLIAEAVSRVTNGENPQKVATEQAKKMRKALPN